MNIFIRKPLLNAVGIDIEDHLLCLAEIQRHDEIDGRLMEFEDYLVGDAENVEEQISEAVTDSITKDLGEEHRVTLASLQSNFQCCFASDLLGSIPAEGSVAVFTSRGICKTCSDRMLH